MKLARFGFFTVVLMFAAQSIFACIVCGASDCEFADSGPRCKPTMDGCIDGTGHCPSVHVDAVASQWTIASVEIEQPQMQRTMRPTTTTVSTHPVVAQLAAPHQALSH